jgi:recombination protein RecA
MSKASASARELVRDTLESKFKSSSELFPDFKIQRSVDVIKTSSAILNAITVVGGFPRGRVTELFGPESTGKTTIATEAAIAAQIGNPSLGVLYVDFEHSFDASYAHALGLNLADDSFILCQPDSFEQGEEIIMSFLSDKDGQPRNLLSLIIIDSAAAMTPLAELEGGGMIGLQARLMSKFLARITKRLSQGVKPALIVLNQTRTKIDMFNPRNTGEDSASGKALKFYSTIRLRMEALHGEGKELRQKEGGNTDQVFTHQKVRITCCKNKVAPPWQRGTLVFTFGKGIDNVTSVAELAIKRLGVTNGGGFFNFNGSTAETSISCRGYETWIETLKSSPAVFKEVEARVLDAIRQDHRKLLGVEKIEVAEAKVIDVSDSEVVEDTVTVVPGGEMPVEDII